MEAKQKFEERKIAALSKGEEFSETFVSPVVLSGRWDWDTLRKEVAQYGVRNSLLVAPMPTASTSQILGNNECIEPYTSNIYSRRVLAGEFTVLNKQLLLDLMGRGLWDTDLKNRIIEAGGSIQNVRGIPSDLKPIYKTVWEISMKTLVNMAADRGQFVDQSQSFNCFLSEPSFPRMSSMFFYGWKKGLKTGMYYLRTRPAADAIKFTVDQEVLKNTTPSKLNQSPVKNENKNSDVAYSAAACPIGCDSCGA